MMNLVKETASTNPILAQVFALEQAGQLHKAGQLLASCDSYFFEQVDSQVINQLLTSFAQPVLAPELAYLQALLLRRTGQAHAAIPLLEQAKTAFITDHHPKGVLCCLLELVQITLIEKDVERARAYLQDEIQPLLDQGVADPTLHAHFLGAMASHAQAVGKSQQSRNYAQQALALYTKQRHCYGQFLVRLHLAKLSMAVGDDQAAEQQWQQAHALLNVGALSTPAEIRLLWVQLQLEWRQRQFPKVLETAQRYLTLVEHEPCCDHQIQARLTLGNLYRDSGEATAAYYWYAKTSALLEEEHTQHTRLNLATELAWLYLLEGRLQEARLMLSAEGAGVSCKQRMRRQVMRAVLAMLDGEWETAAQLLYAALTYYETVNAPLAIYAIHIYLAYNALHQGQPVQILLHTESALRWSKLDRLLACPDWWHPKIIAEVCVHALICDLYPAVAEAILVKQVGKAALGALKLLEETGDIELRRTAARLQQIISGLAVDLLTHLRDSNSKQTLQTMLVNGHLRPESYPELERELMTANNRLNPNPTIVAVFGLYVNGVTREQMAEQLGCSLENVRNYITMIYQHFALPADHFPTRASRKKKLIEIARQRGFIY